MVTTTITMALIGKKLLIVLETALMLFGWWKIGEILDQHWQQFAVKIGLLKIDTDGEVIPFWKKRKQTKRWYQIWKSAQ